MVNDPEPRVRLHAVIAASFSTSPKALAIAMEASVHPMDPGIEHALAQTLGFLSGRPEPAAAPGPNFQQLAKRLQRGENPEEVITASLPDAGGTWPNSQMNGWLKDLLNYLKRCPAIGVVAKPASRLCRLAKRRRIGCRKSWGRHCALSFGNTAPRCMSFVPCPARMKYDREEISVTAGESIRLVFENNDTMPHNWYWWQLAHAKRWDALPTRWRRNLAHGKRGMSRNPKSSPSNPPAGSRARVNC